MFTAPTWFEGLIFYLIFIIPIIIGLILIYIKKNNKIVKILGTSLIILGVVFLIVSPVVWHYTYEVPSVNEKVVKVGNWQPRPGLEVKNGFMVIDSADDLMMVTDTGEGFKNTENFLFFKFDTRDILNKLKPNGTYKIKYYGWREGFNNGFPNILSVEEVIDENGTVSNDLNNYMGNRMITS